RRLALIRSLIDLSLYRQRSRDLGGMIRQTAGVEGHRSHTARVQAILGAMIRQAARAQASLGTMIRQAAGWSAQVRRGAGGKSSPSALAGAGSPSTVMLLPLTVTTSARSGCLPRRSWSPKASRARGETAYETTTSASPSSGRARGASGVPPPIETPLPTPTM